MLLIIATGLSVTGCGGNASGTGLTVRPVLVWGGAGLSDGRFSLPRVIDTDADGTVYVIDKAGRMQQFDLEGHFIRGWQFPEMDNGKPTGMGIAPNGNLYVADTHNSRVDVCSRTGSLLKRWGSYGTGPGQFIYPTDVAVSAKGNVFVTDYGEADRIQVFDLNGEFLSTWGKPGEGPGEFQRPMAIALDGKGGVYVADAANHRVQKFTEEGRLLLSLGGQGEARGQMKYPYDVIVGGDGMVYVCEYGNCRVQKFTPSGEPLAMWGLAGREPGMFAQPWGVAMRGAAIFVADTNNHRIQKFVF